MVFLALVALAVVLLAIGGVRKLHDSKLTRGPHPPGPPLTVFLGKVFGLNGNPFHVTYAEWAKTYGDIIYTRVLGHDIVVLNSEQAATDLLERRSQKYSDRPAFHAANLLGWGWASAFARYGPRFRLHRRLLHQMFRANVALTYRPRQMQRAYELVANLLRDSASYEEHFTTFSASIVMAVTYGYDVKGRDAFVTSMQHASDVFLRLASPQLIVMSAALPFLEALPAWLPGMGFKSKAAECRRLTAEAVNAPYVWTKQHVEEGNAAPSMVADAITRYSLEDNSEHAEIMQATKDSAGTLYGAAVGTTNAVLLVFVYLMMNHPEAQRRAQMEIDRMVGRQRLPDFEDRPSLPYVDAVLREVLRLHPVATIIPHSSTEDDVYQGYHIPQGALVLANNWAISRDGRQYPNPDVFMPERFLQDDGKLNEDKVMWAFGFGRRICPGRYVADASSWCAMVCILALFTIEKTEGSDNVEWVTTMAVHPVPFPCKFVPRDKEMNAERLESLIHTSRADL